MLPLPQPLHAGALVEAKLQALWTVEVETPRGWAPAGVLIFHLRRVFGDFYEEGRLFGGDRNCVYVGRYSIEEQHVRGSLEVRRYAAEAQMPFGPEPTARLEFSGRLDSAVDRDVVRLKACLRTQGTEPISLRLTRRATLA